MILRPSSKVKKAVRFIIDFWLAGQANQLRGFCRFCKQNCRVTVSRQRQKARHEKRSFSWAPHLVVEDGAEGALLVDKAVVGKNEVRAVHLIMRMCFEFTHKTPFIGAAGERPRSFLLREDELADGDLLGSGSAGVHGADPFEPVSGLEVLGHALGTGELIGDALDHSQRVVVDLDEVVVQGVCQKQLGENALAVLLQKPLAHASEAADIALGLLGHGKAGGVMSKRKTPRAGAMGIERLLIVNLADSFFAIN